MLMHAIRNGLLVVVLGSGLEAAAEYHYALISAEQSDQEVLPKDFPEPLVAAASTIDLLGEIFNYVFVAVLLLVIWLMRAVSEAGDPRGASRGDGSRPDHPGGVGNGAPLLAPVAALLEAVVVGQCRAVACLEVAVRRAGGSRTPQMTF